MARTVAVFGASGFVGRSLVAALRDTGDAVRFASRHRPDRELPGVAWVDCDLERPESLGPALGGVDIAYYLVHSVGTDDFRATDRRYAQRFASAAERSDCPRVVYLGGVAPRGRPSEHLASRLEVGEILRAGGAPALELRASMIVGNGSASWRILRDLAARLPFMVLPRWLESRTCPIALPDVIAALLAARTVPLAGSAWFDLPGPDVLSMREMLEIVAELDGRRVPFVRVPVLTPGLSSLWLRLVTGVDYGLARELVLGLTADLLPQRSFWDVAGLAPRWSFRDAAAAALSTEAPPSAIARGLEQLVRRLGPHTSH